MPTGTVKWFNNAKGYGFILPEGGGGDLFAHYSVIEMEGYKTLKAGQPVTFDVVDGNKGRHAVHIKPLVDALGQHNDFQKSGLHATPLEPHAMQTHH
ncbi:cold shock domain-containing protein CspD [Marinibactrum halimedae]|uniref:Cold shock-like protein CspD n=1 Tax=Marinibactrum halimedae TaxID=1444977 RepID=A0AA37T868_9GAMM|nr:cold shock domain-containing protein CspD [Marinibactrum halimedae]GLS27459.1 hypothetical protein GCM10007877_31780 [Marinibactrum halimedae]